MRRRLAAILVPLLAGCGAVQGGLQQDAALTTSTYVALDLDSGAVTAVAEAEVDLDAACWRDGRMLFRRIAAGSYGTSDAGLGTGSAATAAYAVSACWVGVFEVTRAQWRRLAADPPHDLPADLAALNGTSAGQPVTAVAPAVAAAAVAGAPLRRLHLRLPSSGEWVAACAGGSPRLFAWGDGTGSTVTATYANTLIDPATAGLAMIGSRRPAAGGFCDMHGNAWEIVDDGGTYAIRGGAWDQPVAQARTANRVPIPADLAHPTVGLRLVLAP